MGNVCAPARVGPAPRRRSGSGCLRRKPQDEMVYVIGAAGVGKTTWIRSHLSSTHVVIDLDQIMKLCPLEDANPEERGSISFRWAKERSEAMLVSLARINEGLSKWRAAESDLTAAIGRLDDLDAIEATKYL